MSGLLLANVPKRKIPEMLNALLSLCIEQPAFPATIGIILAIVALAILAAFEYGAPRRLRRPRYVRRYSRR